MGKRYGQKSDVTLRARAQYAEGEMATIERNYAALQVKYAQLVREYNELQAALAQETTPRKRRVLLVAEGA